MILEILAIKEINKPTEIPEPPPPPPIVKEIKKPKPKPKLKLYKIKTGDTLNNLSKRFRVPQKRLLCANHYITNPDVIHAGEVLKIPNKKQKLKCPKKTQGIQSRKNWKSVGHSIAPSGYYPYGQCTWLVWTKRPVGRWHDATSWWSMAIAEGYKTGTTPRAGAIGWTYGHVVYVNGVNSDGSVSITEANYDYNGSIRTINVAPDKYKYIY